MPVRLLVPYDQGAVIDKLHGVATDIRQESIAEGTIIEARLPRREANRYAALRIDLPPRRRGARRAPTTTSAAARRPGGRRREVG